MDELIQRMLEDGVTPETLDAEISKIEAELIDYFTLVGGLNDTKFRRI